MMLTASLFSHFIFLKFQTESSLIFRLVANFTSTTFFFFLVSFFQKKKKKISDVSLLLPKGTDIYLVIYTWAFWCLLLFKFMLFEICTTSFDLQSLYRQKKILICNRLTRMCSKLTLTTPVTSTTSLWYFYY